MKKILFLCILSSLLVACTPAPPPTLTTIPTPAPTATPDLSSISDSIDAQLIPINEHGNMICIEYIEKSDFPFIPSEISVSQNDVFVEKVSDYEEIDKKKCFEIIDAKYQVDQLVNIEITLKVDDDIEITTQPSSVGTFKLAPFLGWFFGENGIGNRVSVPSKQHRDAYDFAPLSSKEYPNGLGQPVFLPSSGILITKEYGPDDRKDIHNMFFYLPEVGYYLQIGHTNWIYSENEEKIYEPNTIIGNLTNETGWPHVHTTLRIPQNWNRIYYEGELKEHKSFIDIINPHIQLGGEKLPCGFFICSTLPDIFIDKIDSGFFDPNYDATIGEVKKLY